ncbi:MAG: cell division protein ZapA [Chitinophagales bacterium]|nr:cell division protein ZapA [Chitinophagales bacterium]
MSEKNETVNMSVQIAERSYPLKVQQSDEEKMNNAAKLVNDRIKEYQRNYAGKDKQDYMAMCLLNLAVENLNAQHETQQTNRLLEEKLSRLEGILSGTSQ